MPKQFHFTSESVSEGHPDKIADQISDRVLDAILAADPQARVACETFIKTGFVIVGGEVRTNSWVDIEKITRKTITDIGYTSSEFGFDGNSCGILNAIGSQSPDIAIGVDSAHGKEQGAGDQGMMFGFACKETAVYMPAPITYAHALVKKQSELRKAKTLSWLRPDAKAQVTFAYEDNQPVGIDAVVFSTQHAPEVSQKIIHQAVMEEIIQPVLPTKWISPNTKFHINPTGVFVIGGPMGDCGLTGRKVIVDTYGGTARHGGGAFSGKDPSKVDRSAAYYCRYVAKNVVAAGLADKIELQISYAIGVSNPISMSIDCKGTNHIAEDKIFHAINTVFDFKPNKIIQELDLMRPIYTDTATYGHFGHDEDKYSWEALDKIDALKQAI